MALFSFFFFGFKETNGDKDWGGGTWMRNGSFHANFLLLLLKEFVWDSL